MGQGRGQLHRLARQQAQRPVVVALRSRAAGQGYLVGLATVVQLPVAADLVAVPQHLIQPLLGVPPLGAEHGPLRDAQGCGHLRSSPALIRFQQNARSGDGLRGTPAGSDHLPEPPLLLGAQLDAILLLNHGCHPSHNSTLSPTVASRLTLCNI